MRAEATRDFYGRPAPEEDIRQAEEALGVSFPDSYCWFLMEFGAAEWPQLIYGVRTGNWTWADLVRLTKESRQALNAPIPLHLLPFSPDGWGNDYCMDTSRLVEGECPVVFWNHENGEDQIPDTVFAGFLDWLEDAIRFEMELDAEEAATG
jgi:hypothetical protein